MMKQETAEIESIPAKTKDKPMSERKTIVRLPTELRLELEGKLINEDYDSLDSLSEWLDEKGYTVTKCSINRYKLQLCDGVVLLTWLDKRKPCADMRLTVLQQELGILDMTGSRIAERKKAVEREIKKRIALNNRSFHA